MLINDKMNENIEVIDKYQTIFAKENSIQDLLRKFFKSMHEILYEIEQSKKVEMEYVVDTVFGNKDKNKKRGDLALFGFMNDPNFKLNKDVCASLISTLKKIGSTGGEINIQKFKQEYDSLTKKDNDPKLKQDPMKNLDKAFSNVIQYTVGDLTSELEILVNEYVQFSKLNLDGKSNSAKGDNIHEMFGVEKVFKHK
jgi:hypothetical protein